MGRYPNQPPSIPKIIDGGTRPLWSVIIPAYNAVATLEDTLKSVLIQDRGKDNMQIEVIDDCSTQPGTEEIVNRVGKGRVTYISQLQNRGHVYTTNYGIERARGHYIHILHADDQVLPGYYEKIESLFSKYPDAGAAFTRFKNYDKIFKSFSVRKLVSPTEKFFPDLLETIAVGQPLHYVITTVKRSVYEDIGGFYGCEYGEDWLMWTRVAAKYPYAYSPEILGIYSEHTPGSVSRNSLGDYSFARDVNFVVDENIKFLPDQKKKAARSKAFEIIILWLLDEIRKYWREHKDTQLALNQINALSAIYEDDKTKAHAKRVATEIVTGKESNMVRVKRKLKSIYNQILPAKEE